MSKKWNTKALPMWEGWSKWRKGSPVYDTWLDDYKEELERHRDSVILELGSGVGADTRYLLERGFRVLSTDYSREALLNIKKYIMVNLKVINTLIHEEQQMTALALVATLKNLSAILFQNVAGYILDATSYSFLFGVCFICMLGGLLLLAFFKIESGNHKRLFS